MNTANRNTTPFGTYARVAGLLYLTIIVTGIFAYFFVRASLVAPGDATSTAPDEVTEQALPCGIN